MQKKLTLLAALSLAVGGLFAVPAAVQQLLFTVNVPEVLNGYYKAKDSRDTMQKEADRSQQNLNAMVEAARPGVQEYQDLLQKANNPALTEEARNKYLADAEDKAKALQKQEQSIQETAAQMQRSLGEQANTLMEMNVADVKEAARKIAADRAGGTSFNVLNNTDPILVYADPAFDLTADVLKRLNATQPKPKSTAKASNSAS